MSRIPLNVHLVKESCVEFQDALAAKHQTTSSLHVREPSIDLPFPARLFIQPPEQKAPRWLGFVQDTFAIDPDQLRNQSTGALLLIRPGPRTFAISFGYAGNALERRQIEPDFGLRVVLNLLPEDRLHTLDSRTVEQNTLQRRNHLSQAGGFRDLRIDLEQDWVRSVAGQSADKLISGRVAGGDTVKLAWGGTISDLSELCKHLLMLYERNDYRQKFPEIDRIRPIKENSPEHGLLDARVRARFAPQLGDGWTLAFPELPSTEMARIRYSLGRETEDYDDLSVEGLRSFLRGKTNIDPEKVKIHQLDANGRTLASEMLTAFLVLEEIVDGIHYVLNEGRWFRVEKDYLTKLDESVNAIADLTDVLNLERWRADEKEGDYNKRLATKRGWLLADRTFKHYAKNQKVEACDLIAPPSVLAHSQALNPGPMLIAVKDRKKSASLSHLFAQGVVSVNLLAEEPGLRQSVEAEYRRAFGQDFENDKAICVFAIGDDGKGARGRQRTAAESLFLFSKIALMSQVREIRQRSRQVALCRIEKDQAITSRIPKKP